jgi:hypothetical protein
MFRVTLICEDVPLSEGAQAAIDITENFVLHRPHHTSALCTWTGSALVLVVENDFDDNGLATQDEFSDEISGAVASGFDGDLKVLSVTEF